MDKAEIIISVLKTRLMSREDLNGNQKHGYGLALEEIEKEIKGQLKPQEGEREKIIAQQDRIIGKLTRTVEHLEESESRRSQWLRKAKEDAGYIDGESFDIVWAETLKKAKENSRKPTPPKV